MDSPAQVAMTTDLVQLESFRDLARREVLERLQVAPDGVDEDRSYEGVTGVDHVHNPSTSPAHVYLDGDRVALVYLGEPYASEAFTAQALRQRLGGDGVMLRSRQCKRCILHAYPEAGVAFSAEEDVVGFVEVFPPMSLEEYRRSVYKEPPAFIK